MFISLGPHCNVAHQIRSNTPYKQRQFFDWLMTDFESVIQILNGHQLDPETNNEPVNAKTCTKFWFKGLDCVSIHDVPISYTQEHVDKFVQDYERRRVRLIEIIKSKQHIYFLRFVNGTDNKPSTELCEKFIETIKTINPECQFDLVLVVADKEFIKDLFKIEISENLFKFSVWVDPPVPFVSRIHWTTEWVRWKEVFEIINNKFK